MIGALAAGALGCTAGTLLRPELGPARTGPALVVSEAPALPDTVSYGDRWWSVQRDDPAY